MSGKDAFVLYDTYGFPLEITQELAAAHNVHVDVDGFTQEMQVDFPILSPPGSLVSRPSISSASPSTQICFVHPSFLTLSNLTQASASPSNPPIYTPPSIPPNPLNPPPPPLPYFPLPILPPQSAVHPSFLTLKNLTQPFMSPPNPPTHT